LRGGLNEVFGFSEASPSRTRREIAFDTSNPLAKSFDHPRERVIPFAGSGSGANATGSFGYLGANEPLARFDDGTAAITSRNIGTGQIWF